MPLIPLSIRFPVIDSIFLMLIFVPYLYFVWEDTMFLPLFSGTIYNIDCFSHISDSLWEIPSLISQYVLIPPEYYRFFFLFVHNY